MDVGSACTGFTVATQYGIPLAPQYRGGVRVAILGTRGVPASYGGFETAVEEVGSRLAERGYEVIVYCRNPGQTLNEYRGMKLVNMPALRHRMTETLSHTAVSSVHAVVKDKPDVALVLNAGNAPLIPPLQMGRIPVAVHLDGLESRREKWRGMGARYYRWAEKSAALRGDAVIADSHAIATHVQSTYARRCEVITYGARVFDADSNRLSEIDVVRRDFHALVARLEPENHVLEAVHGFLMSDETRPLVVVGSAPYSQWYIDKVHAIADGDPRIRFLGGIYDQDLLDQIYSNCRTYVHGHSVGGTNPSLLRAMGAGAPVLAFDCEFNREVTADRALFWSNAEQLAEDFDDIADGERDSELSEMSREGRIRIQEHYQWDSVTNQYEALLAKLQGTRSHPKTRGATGAVSSE